MSTQSDIGHSSGLGCVGQRGLEGGRTHYKESFRCFETSISNCPRNKIESIVLKTSLQSESY